MSQYISLVSNIYYKYIAAVVGSLMRVRRLGRDTDSVVCLQGITRRQDSQKPFGLLGGQARDAGNAEGKITKRTQTSLLLAASYPNRDGRICGSRWRIFTVRSSSSGDFQNFQLKTLVPAPRYSHFRRDAYIHGHGGDVLGSGE